MSAIAEKVRPSTWAEVAGQEKAVAKLRRMADRGELGGNALWITGSSGTGKTTIAKLAAAEIASDWCIEECDAQSLTVADLVSIERTWHLRGIGLGGRAYLVNEAHALRRPVIRQLLVMLERIPSHCLIVFTTTNAGQDSLFEDCEDSAPLLSRCFKVELSRRDLLAPFADRLQALYPALPREKAERFLKESRNNLREAIYSAHNWELEQ